MPKKSLNASKRRSGTILVVIAIVGVLAVVLAQALTPKFDLWTGPLKENGAVTVGGTAMCLPHRDTTGPQTEECAIGLKAGDGYYYALRDSDSQYKNISALPMNEHVIITGTFTKQSDPKYPTLGVIEIRSIEK